MGMRRVCIKGRALWWQVRALLEFNKKELPELMAHSKLKQGTLLRLPQIYVTKSEDETCTSIAARFGQNKIWPERASFSALEVLDLQNKVSGLTFHLPSLSLRLPSRVR